MPIKVHNQLTGQVFIRNFDAGVMATLGAEADPNATEVIGTGALAQTVPSPCYKLDVNGKLVNVYFSQPEPIFKKKIFPFITINRDDMTPNLARWMSVGQLEHRVTNGVQVVLPNGVTGYSEYSYKPQAYPYDIVYTISVWDRYEAPVQEMLRTVLKAIPPVGRFIVYDSLNLERSYEYYTEGGIVNLQEVVDPATRARGYAFTIRVEGELDLVDPTVSSAVTGVDVNIFRKKD